MIISKSKMEGKQGLDALFLYATEGILITNERAEIIRINPSAEKLFGYEKGELDGKKLSFLFLPVSLRGMNSIAINSIKILTPVQWVRDLIYTRSGKMILNFRSKSV